ncbi:MAG: hypothetical protein ACM369_08735 [Acidobacteriota bacterium]
MPAGSSNISVRIYYYDFKNGTQSCSARCMLSFPDATRQYSPTHNPGNGNALIALRTGEWLTNPHSAAAWTVDDVNGVGSHAIAGFGLSTTDASPTITFSCILLEVTYDPPVSGTLSVNLGDASESAGEGDVPVAGTSSPTLGALSGAGTAAVESGVTGVLSSSLGTATVSGTGAVTSGVVGTGAANLAAVTLAGAAAVAIAGVATDSLGGATLSGVANVVRTGTFTGSLAAATEAGTAGVAVSGSESQSLAAVTVTGAAAVTSGPVGVLSLSLGEVSASGTSTVLISGAATPALGAATVGASADVDVGGDLSESLAVLALSGAATVGTGVVTGNLNVTLGGGGVAGQPIYLGPFAKYFVVILPPEILPPP